MRDESFENNVKGSFVTVRKLAPLPPAHRWRKPVYYQVS